MIWRDLRLSPSQHRPRRPWWRQVGAAEADAPEAARLRTEQRDGALARWLLPHLMSASLAAGAQIGGAHSSGGGGGGGDLGDLVRRLALALGAPAASEGEMEAALAAAFGGGQNDSGGASDGEAPASRQLQLLDLALFHTAEAAARLLAPTVHPAPAADAGAGGGAADAAAAAARRAALLAAGLAALRPRVEARLAPGGCECGLLPGDALSLAALLADEALLWTTCCLEVRICGRQPLGCMSRCMSARVRRGVCGCV